MSSSGSLVGRRLSLGHSVLSGVVQVGDDCGEVTVATVGQRGKRETRPLQSCSAEIARLFAARRRTPLCRTASPVKQNGLVCYKRRSYQLDLSCEVRNAL